MEIKEPFAAKWRVRDEWHGLQIVWELWYSCNYRCSYCPWEMTGSWEQMEDFQEWIEPSAWRACWDRVYQQYGSVHLTILGGEPLLYRKVDELLAGITRKHFVTVVTNLSLPWPRIETLADAVPAERLRFSASFHPQYTEAEPFLEKLRLLKRRGFECSASVVAWPPFMDRLDSLQSLFGRNGFPLWIQVFFGHFENRLYPASYTDSERRSLARHVHDLTDHYELPESPLGKPCASGYAYAKVLSNGDVYRCGSSVRHVAPLGNLFDSEFELLEGPTACPKNRCFCGEASYLWDHYQKVHPRRVDLFMPMDGAEERAL